ncbi:hypothetical protein [Psychrobacillus sp. BM2]|uniref:hypothetical protein n=1 Tax=Psychrobacillus sp. BM2 TaxID=3400421 RepID=UPI003B01459E
MKEVEKEKEKRIISDKFNHSDSNWILFFTAFSFVFMGFINSIIQLPKEYIVGVSLSSIFFAFSEYVSVAKKLNVLFGILQLPFLFLAILSLNVLPAIFIANESFFNHFSTKADSVSLLSFGLVLGAIAIKSFTNKV